MTCTNTNITIKCPQCQHRNYETDPHKAETYCKKCGLIIITSYPYTAGKKHKTISDYTKNNKRKKRR